MAGRQLLALASLETKCQLCYNSTSNVNQASTCKDCGSFGTLPLILGLRQDCPGDSWSDEVDDWEVEAGEYYLPTGIPAMNYENIGTVTLYKDIPCLGAECRQCGGRTWLPVEVKEAAWVLMDQYPGRLIRELGGWVYISLEWGHTDDSKYKLPWDAIIASLAQALLEREHPNSTVEVV